jgi:hypothetical protein
MRTPAHAAALAAAAVTAAAAAADTPRYTTFHLAAQKVSFQLPAGWHPDYPLAPGWQWQAVAPGAAAHLYVNALATTKSFPALARAYEQALDRPYIGDPHLDFAASSTRVASLPARRITFRYRNGVAAGHPYEVATIYVFERAGRFYAFDYVATPKLLAAMRPTFERSIASVTL